jgi:hypothetical protein
MDGYLCDRDDDDDDDDDVMIYVFQEAHPSSPRMGKVRGAWGGFNPQHTFPNTCQKKEVKANVQPKSSIPIGAKVEISSKGLYTNESRLN